VRILRTTPVALALGCLAASAVGCSSARPAPSAPPRPKTGLQALLARGDAARRNGDVEGALATYESAVRANPQAIPAHLRYVATMVEVGRRSVARDAYAARAGEPTATQAARVMSARLEAEGTPVAIREVYVAAAREAPGEAWWRLALAEVDLSAADRWIRREARSRDQGDRARAETSARYARAALSRARAALDSAERRAPGLPETDFYRGLLRSLEGDLQTTAVGRLAEYRASAEALRRAVDADPDMVDAWANLADAHYRSADLGSALDAYVRALRLAPSDPDLRDGAGLVLYDLGRYGDAATQYGESARLRPRDATPLLNLGDAWAAAGKYADALAAYQDGLARDPLAVEAHAKMGTVLERLGRLAEARMEYEAYVERGGSNAASVRRRIERLIERETAG
jgi:tetratricopeptide (TPR) repeat protein